MYKQKNCSDFQNHYIYKNISLKLGIAPKHWFTNIKVLWKDPKHVCICMLLPYYIKVTNLKTVLTSKQIKVKQSPLNGLNVTWHAAWAVSLWLLRDNHWWAVCGSWKLAAASTPITYACSRRNRCEHTKHCVLHTNAKMFFTPCIKMVCVSLPALNTWVSRVVLSSLKSTPLAY